MKLGPVLTLLAVVLFGAGMLIVDTTQAKQPPRARPPVVATSAPVTTTASAPATTSPPTTSAAPTATTQGPAPSGFPAKAQYAGLTSDGVSSVAVAVQGTDAIAYFCDGQNEAWLRGKAENGKVTLSGKEGSNKLTGTLTDQTISGSLSVGTRNLNFAAILTQAPNGLFMAVNEPAESRVTWIRVDADTVVGVTTTGTATGPTQPLPPGTTTWTVAGRQVEVKPVYPAD